MKIRAVCFDLDGLMFNTEHVFYDAGSELLERRGLKMTPEVMSRIIGRRPSESFVWLVNHFQLPETPDELLAESREIFHAMLETRLEPMPGLFELLDRIEALQLPKGVATSSPRFYLEDVLGKFDLRRRFPMTLTAEDVAQGKPNPEIYLKAARNLGVAVGEMLVLEDSEAGTKAGTSAGAVVVSVPHEFTAGHNYAGAAHVINTLRDPILAKLLQG